MIVPDHFVSEKLRDPRQRVAKHRASNMTDMHRLGHVRGSKINHDPLLRLCLRNAESCMSQDFDGLFCDCIGAQLEIDEARAGDHRCFAKIVNPQVRDDFLCKRAGIFGTLFS